MIYTFEEELRPRVHAFFEDQRFEVFDEARLLSRNIDIIAMRRRELRTIEMKVHDWKRAIEQAYLNLRVADYSYIALPEPVWVRASPYIKNEAYTSGIGVIGVDGVARQVIKPARSSRIQTHLRQRFVEKLRAG
jgi:hypothetical protein